MHTYTNAHVHMHKHMCTCARGYPYVHAYRCTHVRAYVHMHICAHVVACALCVCTQTSVCVHIHMQPCVYTCTNSYSPVYSCTCMYIHTHALTHRHCSLLSLLGAALWAFPNHFALLLCPPGPPGALIIVSAVWHLADFAFKGKCALPQP